MTIPDDISRDDLERVIRQWIIGPNAERNRAILSRRLFDGICYEPLAEEFELSVSQVKRIINSGTERIYKHL